MTGSGWNQTASDEEPLFPCHEIHEEYGHYLKLATFWIEGVAILVIGVIGVAGNILTVFVLRRIDQNTTFNRLLMFLGESSKFLYCDEIIPTMTPEKPLPRKTVVQT